jgi:hypothetical protein
LRSFGGEGRGEGRGQEVVEEGGDDQQIQLKCVLSWRADGKGGKGRTTWWGGNRKHCKRSKVSSFEEQVGGEEGACALGV